MLESMYDISETYIRRMSEYARRLEAEGADEEMMLAVANAGAGANYLMDEIEYRLNMKRTTRVQV
ncbi:MAG: hypothetical protein Q4P84_08620 [Elusimicrobiales bacterium]|nr:hypothetical protein [Elusimicrobiales bacterium]